MLLWGIDELLTYHYLVAEVYRIVPAAELPYEKFWQLTKQEHAVEGARQNIREGETIAEPLKRSGEFPALVTHMIAVGERSGEMEEMLRRIGHIYDGEVDRVITRFTSLLEPIMILVMGILVFCIVVAILLPIFEMGQMVR
jgi:general secretion pathway protein F